MNRTISSVLFGLLLLALLVMLPIGWMTVSQSSLLPDLSGQHLTKSPTEYYGDIATAIVDRVDEAMLTFGGQTDQRRVYSWNFTDEFPTLDINPELAEPLVDRLNAVHEDVINSAYTYYGTENIVQMQLPDGKAYVVCYHAGRNPNGASTQFAIADHDYFFHTVLPDAYALICTPSDDENMSGVPAWSADRPALSVYLHPAVEGGKKILLSESIPAPAEQMEMAANRAQLGDQGYIWVFGPSELSFDGTAAQCRLTTLLALWLVALCLAAVLFIRGVRAGGLLAGT